MNSSTHILSFDVRITRIDVMNEPIKFELEITTNNVIDGVWKTNVFSNQIEMVTSLTRLHIEKQFQKFLDGDLEFYDKDGLRE